MNKITLPLTGAISCLLAAVILLVFAPGKDEQPESTSRETIPTPRDETPSTAFLNATKRDNAQGVLEPVPEDGPMNMGEPEIPGGAEMTLGTETDPGEGSEEGGGENSRNDSPFNRPSRGENPFAPFPPTDPQDPFAPFPPTDSQDPFAPSPADPQDPFNSPLPDAPRNRFGERPSDDLTDKDILLPRVQIELPSLQRMTMPATHHDVAERFFQQALTAVARGDRAATIIAIDRALDRNAGYLLAGGFPVLIEVHDAEVERQFDRWSVFYNAGFRNSQAEKHNEAARNYALAVGASRHPACVGWALNNLAFDLAVCPDKDYRNPNLAINYAKQACQKTDWYYWAFLGTLARCYAEDEQYDKAVRVTQAYLRNAPLKKLEGSTEPPVSRVEMEYNLRRFLLGKPWQDLPSIP